MNSYKEAQEYIKKISVYGSVLGLFNMEQLMNILGAPYEKAKIIHIAGTNGKGSVGAFIESILEDNGYSVGRYISPAVSSYLEKFTINSLPISEESFVRYLSIVAAAAEELSPHPTVFEVETAVALLALSKCDYILLETGLGGRGDATNIIKNCKRAVITSVSRDHSAVLGETLKEIAYHKAGIIKPGTIAVSASQKPEVMGVIEEECRRQGAELIVCKEPENVRFEDYSLYFDTENEKNLKINMIGSFQPQNAALAVCVCKSLGISSVRRGLERARWQGRFEILSRSPMIIADGAHNEDAAKKLAESLEEYFPQREIYFIMGMLADKDYDRVARITAPLASKIYTITPKNPRALENTVLMEEVKRHNANVCAADIETALSECVKNPDAVTVAFGSLSFLGEFRNIAGRINGESK
ncbi:MAG: bifunctional folylpolyglutamate synthase/dihydrofolate synthase [Clostridiales bacterium]|nr:bifunctional folylpolyglutamate synthase/dihydrofolate synthase [Clostridiales bacterium]